MNNLAVALVARGTADARAEAESVYREVPRGSGARSAATTRDAHDARDLAVAAAAGARDRPRPRPGQPRARPLRARARPRRGARAPPARRRGRARRRGARSVDKVTTTSPASSGSAASGRRRGALPRGARRARGDARRAPHTRSTRCAARAAARGRGADADASAALDSAAAAAAPPASAARLGEALGAEVVARYATGSGRRRRDGALPRRSSPGAATRPCARTSASRGGGAADALAAETAARAELALADADGGGGGAPLPDGHPCAPPGDRRGIAPAARRRSRRRRADGRERALRGRRRPGRRAVRGEDHDDGGRLRARRAWLAEVKAQRGGDGSGRAHRERLHRRGRGRCRGRATAASENASAPQRAKCGEKAAVQDQRWPIAVTTEWAPARTRACAIARARDLASRVGASAAG